MTQTLRIAVSQINPTVGDIEGNVRLIKTGISEASARKSDLVLFPELSICGYPPEDLLFNNDFINRNLAAVRKVCAYAKNITAVAGFVDRSNDGSLFNAACVLSGGKHIATYRKVCLPNYGVFDEKRYFKAGNKLLVLNTFIGRVGISICEDLWPENSAFLTAARNLKLSALLNLSASPYHFGKHVQRDDIFKKRAVFLNTQVVFANLVGGQDELIFDGSSGVWDANGKVVCAAKRFEEDLMLYDLKPSSTKIKLPRHTSKRIGGLGIDVSNLRLPQIKKELKPQIKTNNTVISENNSVEEIYQALCLGTHDYVKKNGFRKVLIGISGGIDSALVTSVACDAVGSTNVVCVTMPSSFSSIGTQKDAKRVSGNFKTDFIEIPIDAIRSRYDDVLGEFFKNKPADHTEENIQARIRGNLLMALSNKFNYLVLTTGNKSELAVGYCTLYGDMAGGFAVIKDVPKMMVYKLCCYRNSVAGFDIIPTSVIKRAPSAELKKDQKDTDSLPVYSTLDPILEKYIECNFAHGEITSKISKKRKKQIKGVLRKVDSNEYKRRQGPIGVKITPKAFGRDRRMPITNRFVSL